MKDFIKKGANTAAGLGKNAVKGAAAAMVGEIVKDIMKETGAADVAKDKLMEIGMKVVGDMGVDPQKMQRDLIKNAIKKELNLNS